jgi:hypothetical protein
MEPVAGQKRCQRSFLNYVFPCDLVELFSAEVPTGSKGWLSVSKIPSLILRMCVCVCVCVHVCV